MCDLKFEAVDKLMLYDSQSFGKMDQEIHYLYAGIGELARSCYTVSIPLTFSHTTQAFVRIFNVQLQKAVELSPSTV